MAALRGVAALVAILGLVCCSSLAAASIEQQHAFDDALLLDDAQPQAVPNRRGSRTLTQAFDALETFDDADIQTGVPGDVLYGGYGYYGATPSPVPTAEPTPAPTYTPSTTGKGLCTPDIMSVGS